MSALTNTFTDIADAIRAKTSTTITYKPTEMANAINNISSGMTLEGPKANVASQFNLPVIIPNSVTNLTDCFHNCFNFNQLITIPNSVTSIANCFSNCHNFNQPITIPNSVTLMTRCFRNCFNFNQPITIPNGVTSLYGCFLGCTNFGSTIRIDHSMSNVRDMFRYCNNSKVKTIITAYPSNFLASNTYSIVGNTITWTQSGSNYYNTAYNIYINYSANPLA